MGICFLFKPSAVETHILNCHDFMPSFTDLLFPFAFNLWCNDDSILKRPGSSLSNPMWAASLSRGFSFIYLTIGFVFLLKGWMNVWARVIYPAFSPLSLCFVFSCSCYGCLLSPQLPRLTGVYRRKNNTSLLGIVYQGPHCS